MYADNMSEAMTYAIKETNRRRQIQLDYNLKHQVTPVSIQKEIRDKISIKEELIEEVRKDYQKISKKDREKMIRDFELEMKQAAKDLNFERAAELRDLIFELKAEE